MTIRFLVTNRIIGTLLALFYGLYIFGQNEDAERIKKKFDDVKVAYLEHSSHYDIKYEAGEWNIKNRVVRERIYLDEDVAPLLKEGVSYNSFFDLTDISASTYSFNGSRYKKKKVYLFSTNVNTSENSFYDDGKEMTFTYSDILPNSKTRLDYVLELSKPQFLTPFYMQSYYPAEKLELSVSVPSNIEIGYRIFNMEDTDYKYTSKTKGDLTIHKWSRQDIDKFKYEYGAPPLNYFVPQVHLFIKKHKVEGVWKNMLGSPELLHQYYRSLIEGYDSAQDQNNSFLMGVVDSIQKKCNNEKEIVKGVYQWVQRNIKYIAFEYELAGFIPRPAHLVCDRKYGDCKDMANTIKYMLSLADIKGYLTWIGTTRLPYKYTEISTPSVDNHMICTYIDSAGRAFFLDATDSQIPFGYPASHIQGKQALVEIQKDSSIVLEVPIMDKDFSKIIDSVSLSISGNSVVGSGRLYEYGYIKNNSTYNLLYKDETERLEFYKNRLELGSNNFYLDTFQVFNLEDKEKPLIVDYAFHIPKYITSYQDEMYINLNLYTEIGTKIEEDRELPFLYKINKSHVEHISLNIPKGYTLQYVPENLNKTIGDFSFDITYKTSDSKIEYTFTQSNNSLLFTPENFDQWNEALEDLKLQFSESIVLKKTSTH